MSALHDWHREVFTKSTEVELVVPAQQTQFGGVLPERRSDVKLKSARTVVIQRIVNALTPEEWKHAQAAFDASDEGQALADKDASVRREHCELWLLRSMFEAEHPDLVPHTELALEKLLAVHAHPSKISGHKARLVAHVAHGKPLAHVAAVEVKS